MFSFSMQGQGQSKGAAHLTTCTSNSFLSRFRASGKDPQPVPSTTTRGRELLFLTTGRCSLGSLSPVASPFAASASAGVACGAAATLTYLHWATVGLMELNLPALRPTTALRSCSWAEWHSTPKALTLTTDAIWTVCVGNKIKTGLCGVR